MSIECKHICINQLAHGMGDSCFNGGMAEITKDVGTHIGTYSVCVPTGDNWLSDYHIVIIINMVLLCAYIN